MLITPGNYTEEFF